MLIPAAVTICPRVATVWNMASYVSAPLAGGLKIILTWVP